MSEKLKALHFPSIREQQLPAFLFSFGASEMGKDGILNIIFDPLPTWNNWTGGFISSDKNSREQLGCFGELAFYLFSFFIYR